MKTTVSSKGQIVLPAAMREEDDVRPGQVFDIERLERGEYHLERRPCARDGGLVALIEACPVKGWFEPMDWTETTADRPSASDFVSVSPGACVRQWKDRSAPGTAVPSAPTTRPDAIPASGATTSTAASPRGSPRGALDVTTSERQDVAVSDSKRSTIYLDPALHRALRLKSAETECTISDLVNQAVRESLAEDADDLAAIEERAQEPARSFQTFVADLRRRGKL